MAAREKGFDKVLIHLEVTGPFVTDYSPRVTRLTRWQRIIEYLKVLYR